MHSVGSARRFRCTDIAGRARCARRIRCRRSSTPSRKVWTRWNSTWRSPGTTSSSCRTTRCCGRPSAPDRREKAVIHELTLAQVREWDCGAKPNPAFPKQQAVPGHAMPTLEEVFALAPKGKFLFNIETKIFPQKPELTPPPDEFARMVLAAIRKHHLESRVVLQILRFPHPDRDEERWRRKSSSRHSTRVRRRISWPSAGRPVRESFRRSPGW